jgi:hypothetical protein
LRINMLLLNGIQVPNLSRSTKSKKNLTREGLVTLADCNLRSRGTGGPGQEIPEP